VAHREAAALHVEGELVAVLLMSTLISRATEQTMTGSAAETTVHREMTDDRRGLRGKGDGIGIGIGIGTGGRGAAVGRRVTASVIERGSGLRCTGDRTTDKGMTGEGTTVDRTIAGGTIVDGTTGVWTTGVGTIVDGLLQLLYRLTPTTVDGMTGDGTTAD